MIANLAKMVLFAACAAFAMQAAAQPAPYPNRPIRVIVPWPPGQATDLAARMVAEKLASVLGQPLVIENRPGAGGMIGTEAAAKAQPDGYTLLAGSSGPISISPNVQKVPYDPLKDFVPISLIEINPYVLVVNPSIPAANVKELVALLRANPGKYSFSSSGSGATTHLITVLFNTMTQVTATHVPYKGSSQSVADVVSGQVAYTIETVPAVISYTKSGRLKAFGVTTVNRATAMPELPTIAEAGDLPGYDVYGWAGLLAPAGTPREVSARLSTEIQKILQDPEVKNRFTALGMDAVGNTPEEFSEFLRKQHVRYGSIAKEANLKAD